MILEINQIKRLSLAKDSIKESTICHLKGYLYSTTFTKSCQTKKPDNSHPTLKKGINKRAHSNAHLQYITKSKSCQRKSLFKKMSSRTAIAGILQDHHN